MSKKRLDIGSHRICSAQETLNKWHSRLIDFGITRIADVTGLDRVGIPVTLAIRPNSRSVAVSQGKGVSLADAKASAMMEAIEIWHAEHFDKPVIYGKESDLQVKHRIANTMRLPKVRGYEYQADDPMLWVQGTECFSNEKILVPYEMVHADYTYPGAPIHGTFHSSTNGLASGNSRLEAICHALTELIERDALSLWHQLSLEDQHVTCINSTTIDSKPCLDLLHKFERADLECRIWEVTSDISVPCVMAIIREKKGAAGHIGLGSGCHLDRGVATRRALTEAAQTRLNYVSGARDDLELSEYAYEGLASKTAFADALFTEPRKQRSFQDLPHQCFDTLEQDYEHLLACLASVGTDEIIAVELTRKEYGVDVYRVVVPGLESPHDDETYQPGERFEGARR